jgi:hypothetical protein
MNKLERLRAYRSLIVGVQELQREWPDLPEFEGRINDLCGFLFATLPLSERAIEEDAAEENSWQRVNKTGEIV